MLRIAQYALALLAVPIFLGVTERTLSLGHFFGRDFNEDGFAVNINVIVPILGAISLLVCTRIPKILVAYVSFMVLWLTASMAVGMAEEPSVYNVIFYIQTILPLFAIFAGYALITDRSSLERVESIICGSMAIFVFFLWFIVLREFRFSTFLIDRNTVMVYLAAGIPQFRNYFPASTLIVFNLALARYIFDESRRDHLHTLTLLSIVLFFPLCWSRSALLGFSLSLAIQIVLALHYGHARAWNKTLFFSVGLAFLLPLVIAKLGVTVTSRVANVNDIVDSDLRRLDLFKEGLHQAMLHPVFGERFVPKWDVLAGGQEVAIKRLFPAHNQFIDFLLRGGFAFLLAFLAMLFDVFRRAHYGLRLGTAQRDASTTGICVATIAALSAFLIGANFQMYFVQLQSAVPIFFLIGAMFRTVDDSRVTAARTSGIARPRSQFARSTTPRVGVRPATRIGPGSGLRTGARFESRKRLGPLPQNRGPFSAPQRPSRQRPSDSSQSDHSDFRGATNEEDSPGVR